MGRDLTDGVEPGLKVLVVDVEEGHPKSESKSHLLRFTSVLRRSFNRQKSGESPWPRIVRHCLYLFTAALALAVIAIMYEAPLPFFFNTQLIT